MVDESEEIVARHVAQGNAALARQRQVIEWLGKSGAPTRMAEDFLEFLNGIQAGHEAHLARLKKGTA
jgi:hypothetical protein